MAWGSAFALGDVPVTITVTEPTDARGRVCPRRRARRAIAWIIRVYAQNYAQPSRKVRVYPTSLDT